MHESEFSQCRSVHLFSEVGEADFAELMDGALLRQFPARDTLIEEGESPDVLHIVIDGSVQLFAGTNGQETTIVVLRPATAFVLAAVVGDHPYLASARTLQPSRILMIPSEAVRALFSKDAGFARIVVREIAEAFSGVLTELKNHKLRTGMERLADWLLRANAQLGESGRFTMPCDKRTLASRLGMTPENLSRNLKTLSGYGVVTNGRNVTLSDPAALAGIGRSALLDKSDRYPL